MATNVMERCCASGAGLAAERAEEAALAAQEAAKNVANAVDLAADAVTIARDAQRILDMKATAHPLDAGEEPTAEYDKVTNTMDFGLPRGDQGETGERGPQGDTPYILNNTWWIGDVDTGVPLAVHESGLPQLAVCGNLGSVSATLPKDEEGRIAYVSRLGLYRFTSKPDILPDGEFCIASAEGEGGWEMVVPGTEAFFALAQRVNDSMPLTVTKAVTWTSINAGASKTQAVAVQGAVVNSPCFVSASRLVSGLVLSAAVTADGTVTLTMSNMSTAAITPASGMYVIKIFNS